MLDCLEDDADGALTKTSAYDAFGNVVAESGSSENNRLANTKERDASLGPDNHGFRYYDPATARYLTRDPIGYADGPNVYLSVHNNPVNEFDPLGLQGHNNTRRQRTQSPQMQAFNQSINDSISRIGGQIASIPAGLQSSKDFVASGVGSAIATAGRLTGIGNPSDLERAQAKFGENVLGAAAASKDAAIGAYDALRTGDLERIGHGLQDLGVAGLSTAAGARLSTINPKAGNAGDRAGAQQSAESGAVEYLPNGGFADGPYRLNLQPGTRVDRYGRPQGNLVAPQGTPLEQRALATPDAPGPLFQYEVLKPTPASGGHTAP